MAQDSGSTAQVESPSAPRPPPHREERRREREQAPWVPKTRLGELVSSGKITSLEEIFEIFLSTKTWNVCSGIFDPI